MANKLGKCLLSIAAAGIAVGGVVCYFKNKDKNDADDFDNEPEDDDFDLDNVVSRGYVSLTPASDEEDARKDMTQDVKEAADKASAKIKEVL